MKFLLDTNTCIGHMTGRAADVCKRLSQEEPEHVVVCSVVKAELYFGAMKSMNPARNLARQNEFLNQFASLSFDDDAALHYAQIRATLEISGKTIGPNDMMIAAIALTNGQPNISNFDWIPAFAGKTESLVACI